MHGGSSFDYEEDMVDENDFLDYDSSDADDDSDASMFGDDSGENVVNPAAEEIIKLYKSAGDSKLFVDNFGKLQTTEAPRDYENWDPMDLS